MPRRFRMSPAPDFAGAGTSHSFVLASDPLAVRAGLAKMAGVPPLSQLTSDQRGTVEVVLAEVLNNVAEHAYAGGPGQISVSLRLLGARLACQVTDSGLPMPGNQLPAGDLPGQAADPAVGYADLALSDLPEGGFGWHLIRQLTVGLHYVRAGGQNKLSFTIPL
ncbi:MAG: ATP-binding protein [Rhodobacterales bacterium]|nr:MAG: ATP-binding protein [Rhodobacterales bacterium]